MDLTTYISTMYHALKDLKSSHDKFTRVPMSKFAGFLVFYFNSDSRKKSLASLRRSYIGEFLSPISSNAFRQRLGTKCLQRALGTLIEHLMENFCKLSKPSELMSQVGVKGLLMLDSSSITVGKNARIFYPGTRTNVPASIKFHALFDLSKMSLKWWDFSANRESDISYFPPLQLLKKQLIIFDLGYFSFHLFERLRENGIFFVSRVKKTTAVHITEIIKGRLPLKNRRMLFSKKLKRSTNIIELIADLGADRDFSKSSTLPTFSNI